jgi:hypothetical protein
MRCDKTAVLLVLLLSAACSDPDAELQRLSRAAYAARQWRAPLPPTGFVSDGCSLWPDGHWVECCVAHDLTYWMGGSGAERRRADSDLRRCVSDGGHPFMARIMFLGVRAAGVHWLPTPFRWGFGWPYPQPGPSRGAD